MRGADTVILQFKPLSAWGTMRHAMRLPIPWTMRVPIEVPPDAELAFDMGVVDKFFGEDIAQKAEPTRFRLIYTPDGGQPAVLLDRCPARQPRPHRPSGARSPRDDNEARTLTWRVTLDGAPQGIRFDWARLPGVNEATLSIAGRADGRRIAPEMLRLGADGAPATRSAGLAA